MDVNALDIILIALMAVAAVAGFRRGALVQILAIGGVIAGLVVGAVLAPPIASLARTDLARSAIALAVLLGAAVIGNTLGWMAGSWLRSRTHGLRLLGAADAAGGSLVSVVGILLVTWFVSVTLVAGPLPTVSREIQGSAIVQGLDKALPPPPSVLAEVRRFLGRYGFPDVFAGLPPAPAGPVRWPTQVQARQAFARAAPSMVRIVGTACGVEVSGSGFVVSTGYVVTDAHVVAGVRAPQVQRQGGRSESGTTVLFDPRLDLAVIRVDGGTGPPLHLLSSEVGRGAGGAAVGFPGGGDLTGERAAIRQAIDALGHDIYGSREVTRTVYELQADVQPGDSGGPFVLPDGSVAGVVFATSTTDRAIGYAIASTQAIPDVSRGVGRTRPVSTGACVR
jgi:S1-C subfamily serine protease